jgi:hypothetical protein
MKGSIEVVDQEKARQLLSNVSDSQVFKCCDGRVVRNIRELGKTLAHMADDSFYYHANSQKNDFSAWVRETIGDETLAAQLRQSVNKKQTLRELSQRIAFLSGRLAQ